MKDNVRKLELKKLIQEYNFLLTDEVYKKEVINETQSNFLKEIHKKKIELGLTEDKPYQPESQITDSDESDSEHPKDDEKKVISDTKEGGEKQVSDNDKVEIAGSEEKVEKTNKIKKIYRQIVKKTHPDKTNSNEYVESYNKATSAYEKNDLIALYFISLNLDINIDLDEEDILNINKTINNKRRELHNLEKSYLWLWYNAKTKEQRARTRILCGLH